MEKIKVLDAVRDLFDDLTAGQKIMVVVGIFAVVMLAVFGGTLVGGYQIRKLEGRVAAYKTEADRLAEVARQKEIAAAQYKQKIDTLESRLSEIKEIAKTQDEELEKLTISVRDGRSAVERARGVRTIRTTADELCERLEEVGHPCDQ